MDVLKHRPVYRLTALAMLLISTTGCQFGYIVRSGWNQAKLYNRRVKTETVLADPATPAETRRKLELVAEVLRFGENQLGLARTKNYRHFVALDGPYVSYIVHAAPEYRLESYRWWFPIVGHVPYKGFFSRHHAEREAMRFPEAEYDVFVRGVTAYSTLGWFADPIWSSMLALDDHDLVNVIIHETVHATLFIKSQAEFNERMATFLGDWGTELFYLAKEGGTSQTIARIRDEQTDQALFAKFLSREIANLRSWYETSSGQTDRSGEKQERLKAIVERFKSEIAPRLKTNRYARFGREPLNNARLLAFGTYYEDLSQFIALRDREGANFKAVLAFLKNLARSKDPERELATFVSASSPTATPTSAPAARSGP